MYHCANQRSKKKLKLIVESICLKARELTAIRKVVRLRRKSLSNHNFTSMVRLLNTSEQKFEFRLTKNPVSNPASSPEPTGKRLSDAKDANEAQLISKHPSYSESEVVYLRPGINEFKNEEHAEYFYSQLGNPEDGGIVPISANKSYEVTNRNIVLEVDAEGKEVRDNLWLKYRKPVGVQVVTNVDPSLFRANFAEAKP